MNKLKLLTVTGSTLLISIFVSQYAYASSSNSTSTPVAQSYNEGSTVYPGMLVGQDPKQSGSVIPLTSSDVSGMLGVVVPINNAPISLTPLVVKTNQALVASSGEYNVLVSNQDGSIKSGDYLTVSSLSGIAMKAGDSTGTIIGRADSSFNGTSGIIGSETVKSGNSKQTYSIGSIAANIQLDTNPLYAQGSSGLPTFVVKAAYSLANKPVNLVRIYLSIVFLIVVIVIVGSMFYSGVRSGIISIGRNPLSQKSITRGLIQTFVVGIFIFAIGVLAAYLIIIL